MYCNLLLFICVIIYRGHYILHPNEVAHVQPVGEPTKRLDHFNRSQWVQTDTGSKVSATKGRLEVSVRQGSDGWKPEGWVDHESLGFVLAQMVKNKGTLMEAFETGTYVIDPSDHENDEILFFRRKYVFFLSMGASTNPNESPKYREPEPTSAEMRELEEIRRAREEIERSRRELILEQGKFLMNN